MKLDDLSGERKIVRFANKHGGPCTLLGQLVDQTRHQCIYICPIGGPGRRSYIPKRLVHVEACGSCPDHPRSLSGKLPSPRWEQP